MNADMVYLSQEAVDHYITVIMGAGIVCCLAMSVLLVQAWIRDKRDKKSGS